MNKLYRNILIAAALLALIALSVAYLMREKSTQLSPQAKVEFSDHDFNLKMVYCQPSKKGRLIFGTTEEGALQPFGKYWRLGANEATTIEINKDLLMKGEKLAKGVYSVYVVPGKETWKFGFNKVADRWGASEPDYTQDVFVIEVSVNYVAESKEQFTIEINKNEIAFWWDTSKAILPFEIIK